jgi:predicted CXXCH cytochrome family protein
LKKTRILLSIVIMSALAAAAGLVHSQWSSYHDFEGKCLDCHLTVPRPGETPRIFTRDISNMCRSCHKNVQDLSHPVDIEPSMAVPAGFPLDWKGHITCATCHPIHKSGFGYSHLRSRARGEGFCSMCHSDLAAKLHNVSLGTAHVGSSSNVGKYMPMETERVLDELSLRCMQCHDATFSNDSLVSKPADFAGLFHNNASLGVSHPIGVSYLEAKRQYRGAYRNLNELPKEIKLFGGQVGCGSCHNPYSKLHNELVMSNERSALCLACHVK